MLYTLHKNTGPSGALRSAVNDLRTIIAQRLQSHFNQSNLHLDRWLSENFNGNLFKQEIAQHLPQLSTADEWITVMLALTPHLDPAFFSTIISENLPNGGDFPEFGGVKATGHRGLLPTGETAQFVIAGTDLEKRLQLQKLFHEDHYFYQNDILYLEQVREGEPMMSGRILLSPEWIDMVITGKKSRPKFSTEFPAKLATTKMNWDDLVMHPYTAEQVEDVKRWIRYHHILEADNNLSRKINPGYRVLFHGPPGTGKTLTAALLGKQFQKDVYRIDLSQIVSKYIGETEKNLNKIFDKAQHKDWILFFDEADALFGKRTSVQSAHDKYANQEVSFLLQRIEEFSGLMILASNFKSNIDEAFLRRFHAVVHFPMPNAQERFKLWKQSIPGSVHFSNLEELKQLADKYEISGASIINVIQFATLKALSRETPLEIHYNDLVYGIRRELLKEEKSA